MDIWMATEEAYKRGYRDGKHDAVKHGRWIDEGYWGAYWKMGTCSVCNERFEDALEYDWNYCPNCGVEMIKG